MQEKNQFPELNRRIFTFSSSNFNVQGGHILSNGGVALSLVMKNGNVKSKVELGWFKNFVSQKNSLELFF